MGAALVVVLDVVLLVWFLGQCRKPDRFLGRAYLAAMNVSHSDLTDWAMALLHVRRDSVVLDIGCGGGRTIQKLAALAPDGTVHGVDYASGSVAAARSRNAQAIAAGRVAIEQASVAKLPYADRTFDIVTAVETHYYWPNLPENLREVRRVLKPGGTFALVAETHRRGPLDAPTAFIMRLIRGKFMTAGEHERLLSEAGFADVGMHSKPGKQWLCATGRAPDAPQAP